jgi:hypothetical protein
MIYIVGGGRRIANYPLTGQTLCSLGGLEPAPPAQWLALTQEAALSGQLPLAADEDPRAQRGCRAGRTRRARASRAQPPDRRLIGIDLLRARSSRGWDRRSWRSGYRRPNES